jgi:hypothetical protein
MWPPRSEFELSRRIPSTGPEIPPRDHVVWLREGGKEEGGRWRNGTRRCRICRWRGRHRRRRQAPPDFPQEEARLLAIGFGEMGESEKNRGERRERVGRKKRRERNKIPSH